MSVSVQTCVACGQMHYPDALLCFGCAGAAFRTIDVDTATVLASTDVVHRVGSEGSDPVELVLIETGGGPCILARLEGNAPTGSSVSFSFAEKRLTARAHEQGRPLPNQ